MPARLTADIGGTFTDFVLLDDAGQMHVTKTPSTPKDFTRGVLDGIHKLKLDLRTVDIFVHGATVVLNALLQRKLPKTGLITTRGFRDVLEIMRTNNPEMYNLHYVKPAPLIPRHLRHEVTERVRHTGEVLVPLDRAEARGAVRRLKADGVVAIAVCFLHAYGNPSHERAMRDVIREEFPEAIVCLSSDIAPEWREFERTSTTTINAASMPIIAAYLRRLEEQLKVEGLRKELFVMQSNGGVMTATAACQKPVTTVMSGPSGGAIGAAYLGAQIKCPNLITIDIGGTSSDMGLIVDGKPITTAEGTISQWPILTPMIEILSIGAGGGSIAWVDEGGALRVGPQSAGADPGPVCYNLGGTEPTVTDANLCLGRLDPSYFLGGEIRLNEPAARKAVQNRIAERFSMDTVEAANGIIEVLNANMARAMRSILTERGYDPREFVLMAFGGAGGLHTAALMQELGIRRAVVPSNPGALSAVGMLATDFRHDHARTYVRAVDDLNLSEVNGIYRALESQAAADLENEDVSRDRIAVMRSIDARYVGQEYHINLPIGFTGQESDINLQVGSEPLRESDKELLVRRFNEAHQKLYDYCTPGTPVQIVNLRVAGIGWIAKPQFPSYPAGSPDARQAIKTHRQVYFKESGGFLETPIYDILRLRPNNRITGPAIIEDPNSTIVIPPGQTGSIDEFRDVFIEE
jgi:N-methylhydantoinase A